MGTRLVDWLNPATRSTSSLPPAPFLPVWDPPDRHLICIAGGSGVTPFRAFGREAARRKLETKITILYSVRTTNDIIFGDEFQQLQMDNPHFSFYVTCTRLHPEDPWTGRRGRIDGAWVRSQSWTRPRPSFTPAARTNSSNSPRIWCSTNSRCPSSR